VNAPNQQSISFSDLEQATDRLFDRELTSAQRQALSAELSSDPDALKRFRETTDALLALREPIDTPDVTGVVLQRLNERPGFTTRRTRRFITTGRLAVAAALLGAGAGVVLLENYSEPTQADLAEATPEPIDSVIAQLHDKELAAREIDALRADNFFSTEALKSRNDRPLDAGYLDANLTGQLGFSHERFLSASLLDSETPFARLQDFQSQTTVIYTDPFPDNRPWLASFFVPEIEWQSPSARPRTSSASPLLEWSPLQFVRPPDLTDQSTDGLLAEPAEAGLKKLEPKKLELQQQDPSKDED
jgi:anti-sigma factor RsiW